MIIVGNLVPDLFSLMMRVDGVTLYPFIFIRKGREVDTFLVNHEKIHYKQQEEWWWVSAIVYSLFALIEGNWKLVGLSYFTFYIIYFLNFCLQFLLTWSWGIAYRRIEFEREAYKHMYDPDYLSKRESFQTFK